MLHLPEKELFTVRGDNVKEVYKEVKQIDKEEIDDPEFDEIDKLMKERKSIDERKCRGRE